ncbi:hypothetical protein HGRIS_008814 [Hohenbuehelia grisea]|uniref:Subtilisin-like protease n=1 Tax=Hohenbuehelia grisea TaxID=104357 RepID=A0ABR3J954_9AGAR
MGFSLRTSWLFVALAFAASSTFAYVPLSSVNRDDTGRYVPNEYIVEMASVSGLGGKRAYTGLKVHEEVYHIMRARGLEFEVVSEFDTKDIFVGASMKIESIDDVSQVTDIPGVKAVRPVMRIPRPVTFDDFTVSDPSDPRVPPMGTHLMTGVDKLHAEGITGEGIKIGVIDSGIDYTNPALGGAKGSDQKVIGGYDFVGDKFDGSNKPSPDNDPREACNGHGTHVAGIIGANPGNKFGISGVAYKASLAAYRVFGCSGSTTDEILVQSMIRAYNDGMDIITLSIGGVDGWTEGTGSVVGSRIAEQGRVVTIAAGNDGSMGSWYTSGPANGINVMSIGSVNNIDIAAHNVTVHGADHPPMPYVGLQPLNVTGELPIYVVSKDASVTDDACKPLPEDTPDLSGHIVIIRRGTCPFADKMANAAKKGGRAVLFYNTDDGAMTSVGGAGLVSADNGKWLVAQFNAGTSIKLSFPSNSPFNMEDTVLGGIMSPFSSYGPTYDMYFKPAYSAPGGNILSTVPMAMGEFGVKSGTSMATPFAAGAAALVLQAKGKGKDVARTMRDLFQSTSVAIPVSKQKGSLLQSVSQQGAGLINVDHAIRTKTIISPAQLMLNDTANFNAAHTITISNTGSESVTYDLSHIGAGTAPSIQSNSIFASQGPVELSNAAASVTLIPSRLTVSPGSSRRVSVIFRAPSGIDKMRLPVYSGFIKVASKTETLQVTYLGVAGDLKKQSVLDNTDGYFGVKLPVGIDAGATPISSESVSNFSMSGSDVPTFLYRLAFGTPLVRFDLVDKNIKFKPTIAKRDWLSWLWPWEDDVTDVPTIGPLQELSYVPRNSHLTTRQDNGYNGFPFDGKFANFTRVENGEYRVLLRALKVTGNPKRANDYESWLSPVFTINFSGGL